MSAARTHSELARAALWPLEEVENVIALLEKQAKAEIEKAAAKQKAAEARSEHLASQVLLLRDNIAQADARALAAQQRVEKLSTEAQFLRRESTEKSSALDLQKDTLAAYVGDTKAKRTALEQRYVALGEHFERLSDRYDVLLSESARSEVASAQAAAADSRAGDLGEVLRAERRDHAKSISDHEAKLHEVQAAHAAALDVHRAASGSRTDALQAAAKVAAADTRAEDPDEVLRAEKRDHAKSIADLDATHEAELHEMQAAHAAALNVHRTGSPNGQRSPGARLSNGDAGLGTGGEHSEKLRSHLAENNRETAALARENTRLTAECEELRAQLQAIREGSAERNSKLENARLSASCDELRAQLQAMEAKAAETPEPANDHLAAETMETEAARQAACLRDVLVEVNLQLAKKDTHVAQAVRTASDAQLEMRRQAAVLEVLMRSGLTPENALAVERINAAAKSADGGNSPLQLSDSAFQLSTVAFKSKTGFYMEVARVYRYPGRTDSSEDDTIVTQRRFVYFDEPCTRLLYSMVEGAPPLRGLDLPGSAVVPDADALSFDFLASTCNIRFIAMKQDDYDYFMEKLASCVSSDEVTENKILQLIPDFTAHRSNSFSGPSSSPRVTDSSPHSMEAADAQSTDWRSTLAAAMSGMSSQLAVLPSTPPSGRARTFSDQSDCPEWEEYEDGKGGTYYHNASTGETTWDRPADIDQPNRPSSHSSSRVSISATMSPATVDRVLADVVGNINVDANGILKGSRAAEVPLGHGVGLRRRASSATKSSSRAWRQLRIGTEAVVVMDTGSSCVRAGLGGENMPRVVMSLDGSREVGACHNSSSGTQGDAAASRAARSTSMFSTFPFTTDWDGITNLWETIFTDELMLNPADHTVLLSELPEMSTSSRNTMMEIMFEQFDVPSLLVQSSGVLALYAAGISSGIVVDVGNRMCITPVVDGYLIDNAVFKSYAGGLSLTENLAQALAQLGCQDVDDLGHVRKVKEDHCYVRSYKDARAAGVSGDFDSRMPGIKRTTVTINGQNIDLGPELWQCPESLFESGISGAGLHEHIYNSINRCEVDSRADLYQNIVLSGGTNCCEGIASRIQDEMEELLERPAISPWDMAGGAPRASGGSLTSCRVVAPGNRKFTSWLGGSILSKMDALDDDLTWREDWEERGAGHMGER